MTSVTHRSRTADAQDGGACPRSGDGIGVLSLLGATLLLTASALYNGAPLLYADSIDYLLHGGAAARALIEGVHPDWWSTRSFFYALAILPLHAYVTTWPVVIAQSLVTAWAVWLTLRTSLHRPGALAFLACIALLTAFSTVSWFTSYVMPDIFAALLVLGAFLLHSAWPTLSTRERIGLCALVWFAIVSHASHLLLAVGLCLALVISELIRGARVGRWMPTLRLGSLIAAAVASTLLLHSALLGEASLSGKRPVFLLARVIADGTGRAYLRARCPGLDVAICDYVDRLPDNVRDVLWSEGSIWGSSPAEVRRRLRDEELEVVIGAVRSDPLGQLRASAGNAWRQLETFGLWGSYFPDPYIVARIHEALPRAADTFFDTRQGSGRLHEGPIGRVHRIGVGVSLAVILAAGILLGRGWNERLAALVGSVALGVVCNAIITGALSNVEDRYQARVVWLVPLVAYVLAVAWIERRGARPVPGPRSGRARPGRGRPPEWAPVADDPPPVPAGALRPGAGRGPRRAGRRQGMIQVAG